MCSPFIPELNTAGYCGCIHIEVQDDATSNIFMGSHFVDFYLESPILKGFAATCLTSVRLVCVLGGEGRAEDKGKRGRLQEGSVGYCRRGKKGGLGVGERERNGGSIVTGFHLRRGGAGETFLTRVPTPPPPPQTAQLPTPQDYELKFTAFVNNRLYAC